MMMSNAHRSRRRPRTTLLLAALAAHLIAGCSGIHTHKASGEEIVMTQEEFSQYVEHVFRYHNQVMSELMEASADRPELESNEASELNTAEKKMLSACEPLNEVVSESLSGETVGINLKLDLADAVPACENASKQVEDLIP
jgi:hypothetical protein